MPSPLVSSSGMSPAPSPSRSQQAQELDDRLHRALIADGFDSLAQVPTTGVSGVFDHQRGPDPEPVPEEEHDGET